MILALGKCVIETAPCVDGAPAANGNWKALKTPKDGTTKLSQNAGSTTDILEEGGGLVDTRTAAPTGTLEWDEFVKKDGQADFEDVNGQVDGEHAFRVYSEEDENCPGVLIERSSVTVTVSFSTAEGVMRHHVARILKPKTGNMVKRYDKSST